MSVISFCSCSGSILGPCEWCRRNMMWGQLYEALEFPTPIPNLPDIFSTWKHRVADLEQQVATAEADAKRARRTEAFTHDWYGSRWAELKEFLRGTIYHDDACAIMANGVKGPFEPSLYVKKVTDLEKEVTKLRTIIQTVSDAMGKFHESQTETPSAPKDAPPATEP